MTKQSYRGFFEHGMRDIYDYGRKFKANFKDAVDYEFSGHKAGFTFGNFMTFILPLVVAGAVGSAVAKKIKERKGKKKKK